MIIGESVIQKGASFDDSDILGRKQLADGLTNLVKSIEGPLVFALDGPWGTGKTHFLKLWCNELEADGFPVVYFNAFEHDYQGDAFVSLVAEFISLIEEFRGVPAGRKKKFKDASVKVGKTIARSTLNVAIKAASAGVIDATQASDAIEAAIQQIDREASAIVDQAFKAKVAQRKALASFKAELAALPAAMQKDDDGPALPLVFIIDELDRCRPNFSLEILEVVKHFFDVPDVHFVLGCDSNQMARSVEGAYGAGFDGRKYLARFVHFSFGFESQNSPDVSKRFVTSLWDWVGVPEQHADIKAPIVDVLSELATLNQYSLRELQRIMSIISLSLSFIGGRHLRVPPLVVGLAVLRVMSPELYRKAKSGKITYEEAVQYFGFDRETSGDNRSIEWMKEWWAVALDASLSYEDIDIFMKDIRRFNVWEREKILPILADRVIDRFVVGGDTD
ncbi:MAG: hypothetical protein KDD62_12225 [Bdellovibrionales bacterium]|nr:hypothetical protein [Bdellovibrionales bacterium]